MCVLLVEDELMIREIMAESLQDAGYEVLEVETGEQAAAVLADPPKPFTAVVTDFHTPGSVDGGQVAARARAAMPGIPVILMSGRPDVFQAAWRTHHGYCFLKKPYLPSQLVKMIGCLVGLPPS